MVTATMLLALGLLCRRDGQVVAVLVWGWYLGLLLLVNGPDWSWELKHDFEVRPVAKLVQLYVLPGDRVYLVHPLNRPSLSFYSDHLVDSLTSDAAFKQRWQGQLAYFVINAKTLAGLQSEAPIVLGSRNGWYLVSQQRPNRLKNPLGLPDPGPAPALNQVLDESGLAP
jgi:hypothetical protein